eukprot:COSAG01_NODE_59263_length_301_cov_0.772277_1_plen_46_part_10
MHFGATKTGSTRGSRDFHVAGPFSNDKTTTNIYTNLNTLPPHDALP